MGDGRGGSPRDSYKVLLPVRLWYRLLRRKIMLFSEYPEKFSPIYTNHAKGMFIHRRLIMPNPIVISEWRLHETNKSALIIRKPYKDKYLYLVLSRKRWRVVKTAYVK